MGSLVHDFAQIFCITLYYARKVFAIPCLRMGSLVLLVHDFADHWLELAKLAKYAGQEVVQYNFRCGCIFIADLLPRSLSPSLSHAHSRIPDHTCTAGFFYIAMLIFGAQVKLI